MAQEIIAKVQDSLDQLDSKLRDVKQLKDLEDKTGVKPVFLVGGAGVLLLSFIFFGFGAAFLCNLAGFVYPSYMSFKAIESAEKEDDTQWLTYWVVYGFFSVVEVFIDYILYSLPAYYALKFGFLVYLMLPQTKGAQFIYSNVIKPMLSKYEKQIDTNLGGLATKVD
jgi:receptor expression-enhancing protein 5/6